MERGQLEPQFPEERSLHSQRAAGERADCHSIRTRPDALAWIRTVTVCQSLIESRFTGPGPGELHWITVRKRVPGRGNPQACDGPRGRLGECPRAGSSDGSGLLQEMVRARAYVGGCVWSVLSCLPRSACSLERAWRERCHRPHGSWWRPVRTARRRRRFGNTSASSRSFRSMGRSSCPHAGWPTGRRPTAASRSRASHGNRRNSNRWWRT